MKRISIFLMLCLAFMGMAKAQTLTVADGEATNQYIPVYGYYADTDGCNSEFIIPASDLTAMSGNDITAMTFYISQAASSDWGATFQVYLGEVSGTTLSANYGPDDFSIVYEGELDGTGTTMSIEFDAPYHYNGGNLLVGTYVISAGTYVRAYFSGVEAEGAAYYSYDGYWGATGEVQDFIPKTTFTYERPAACPKPTGLTATDNGDGTATVTWNGTAANDFIVTVNGGTPATGQTSPYTFDVDPNTTYNVTVTADCGAAGTSESASISFATHCLASEQCSITLELTDSYGDGWNGGKMQVVDANTDEVYGTYTITSGGSATYELDLCPGTVVNFVYTAGSYGTENGWVIYDAAGEVITEEAGCNSGCDHTNGVQATYTMECPSCLAPKNLQASNITPYSATMSWTGSSDSYLLEYHPWTPTGDDVLPTGTLQPYTFDLSQFSGTGAIVIRHYDVTNMFRLNIDDIVVLDANGREIYSQDFEDCGGVMPEEFTMMDMDGDGENWYVTSSGKINGSYGLTSASWNGDALFPDNWLVLSGIELGGSITFYACGQDASFPAENFNVYVCPDNAAIEVPVEGTSYDAENLLPYTPIAWQVKGLCGDEETNYASSFFSTLDDAVIFSTEGNWDQLRNWTDWQGNALTALPTITDKVRIDQDVTIPSGVVAYAKKASLNGGEITIADGGQLKLDATVEVTIEKDITGYGEKDGYYYFIASPLTTTRLSYIDGWSYVNALTGDYDLYTFDATQELEWINYRSSSTHANFTSGENNPVFISGNGYLYANKTTTTLQFEGSTAVKSHNNVETKEYTYDATSTDGWNGWDLVGNPYTCNAYISYIDAEDNVLEADFYTLNNDNTYSLLSSNDALAPCTGAFINYSATGKVQFASEAPAKRTGMINMNLSRSNKTIDMARLRFGQGHNLQHMSFRNNSSIYMNVDGADYAVVYTENQGEMPVSFKAEENGTYTLSFNTENVELGYLHLIDNMTGKDVDLLSTPSYSFEAKTTDYANRFKLVFATGNADDSFAFFSNGSFVINNEGNATLQVVDVTGRIIKSESINGCANVNVNAAPGVYMIRLVNGDNVKVQKVVVK